MEEGWRCKFYLDDRGYVVIKMWSHPSFVVDKAIWSTRKR